MYTIFPVRLMENLLLLIICPMARYFCCSPPSVEIKSETRPARGAGGRPAPLLRSRTLPAIVAPGLTILQAQIDVRYNGK